MRVLNRLIAISISIIFAGSLLGCATLVNPKAGTTTTIVLTRHADRDSFSKTLNDKGLLRAEALRKAARDLNIVAIYSPDLKRNRDTAKPLAAHLGIKVKVVRDASDSLEITNMLLREHAGDVVLWVGNTGNLKEIYNLLNGEGDPPVTYGDLFVMKIRDKGGPEITRSHYGP